MADPNDPGVQDAVADAQAGSQSPYVDASPGAQELPPSADEMANAARLRATYPQGRLGETRGRADQWAQRTDVAQQQLSEAHKAISDQLDKAAKNIEDMQFEPSEEEKNLRWRAAVSGGTSLGAGVAAGNDALAKVMAEQRQGALQKAQLAMWYPIQAAQQRAQAAQAALNTGIQGWRAASYAAMPQERLNQAEILKELGTGATLIDPNDPTKGVYMAPGSFSALTDQALAKRWGAAPIKVPLPGGGVMYMPPTSYSAGHVPNTAAAAAPGPGAVAPAARAPGVAPTAPTQVNPAARPQVPGVAPAAPPSAVPAPPAGSTIGAQEYNRVWAPMQQGKYQPQLADPTYRGAYVQALNEALPNVPKFDPAQAQTAGTLGQDTGVKDWMAENKKVADQTSKMYNDATSTARQNIHIAQNMLDLLDSPGLKGGPAAASQTAMAIKNQLAAWHVITPGAVTDNNVFNKDAYQLAMSGLKSTFPGRVSNMELQAMLRANPNLAQDPKALRILLQMEIDRDNLALHKKAMWGVYNRQVGGGRVPDANEFDGWYSTYFDPYAGSRANDLIAPIQAKQAQIANMTPQERAARMAELHAKAAGAPPATQAQGSGSQMFPSPTPIVGMQ